MDKSPGRIPGKKSSRTGRRYMAVAAFALTAAAVVSSVYVRLETGQPIAGDSALPDCSVGADIGVAKARSDCGPVPAVASSNSPADASTLRQHEKPTAVSAERAEAAGRFPGVKTSQWHQPGNPFDQSAVSPRVGYTIAEVCAARGKGSSEIYCETDNARSAVNRHKSGKDYANDDDRAESYSISGHVLTAEGKGLGGVTIVASPERIDGWVKSANTETLRFWTRTDSFGAYSFDGLPDGDYSIRVSQQPPYRAARITARSGIDFADLIVERDSEAIIAGQVLTSDGQPLEGVTVLPILLGQPSTLTNDQGQFELPVRLNPASRSVSLRFQRPGYVERTSSVQLQAVNARFPELLQASEVRQLMDPVESWTALTGSVQNSAGKSLSGYRVELRPAQTKQSYQTTTDRNGQFQFPMIEAPAEYRLVVSGGDVYKDFQQTLSLTANNSDLSVVIDPHEFGEVSGQLVNSNGEPVADFDLVYRSSDSLKPNAVVRTDKNGIFAIESAPAGDFVLASQSMPAMLVKGLHLEPGESLQLPLMLDWGSHEIHGTVVDAMNNPVPASRVVLQWSRQADGVTTNATRRTAADTQGRFAFSNLGPGPHLLRVDAPGHAAVAVNHDLLRQGYEVTVRMN